MGGSEAVSYMRELQFCLSSVCFPIKKNPTGTSNVELG